MITVQSFLSFRYARMASRESLLVFRSWYPDSCINLWPMRWAWHLGRVSSVPSVLKIPHTHHHSYAMEGMQMRGHHDGVHDEGVGVAYRGCGCGLQLGMFDDSLDPPPCDCSWYMLPWLPVLENSADIIHVEQTTHPSLLCMRL